MARLPSVTCRRPSREDAGVNRSRPRSEELRVTADSVSDGLGAGERRRRLQGRAFRRHPGDTPERSAFSRSMRRTTWARAGRRTAGSRRSASSIRCRCTASACRSARPGRSTAAHLARLANVAERYQPAVVSEHLAWSTHEGAFFNDLLPLPYTDETLERVCEHIDIVADRAQAHDPARESFDLCRLRRDDDRRDGISGRDRPADRLRPAARRQQRLRQRDQSRLRPSSLPRRFSARRGRRDPSRGLCRRRRRRRPAAPDRRAQFAGSRGRLVALRRGDPQARADADPRSNGTTTCRHGRTSSPRRAGPSARWPQRCARTAEPAHVV